MKKTLVAAATLIAATGAFAQSSVTLYGVVDASLENVKGTDSLTRVSSDNYASSRLGFRGVEDLGSGFKAKFVLESAVKVDTGANGGGSSRFFDRAAWVGLEGAYGELRLGRIDSSIGLLAGNSAILGAQAYDDLKIDRQDLRWRHLSPRGQRHHLRAAHPGRWPVGSNSVLHASVGFRTG